jgi:AcrR family transcriptional regulator
MSDRSTEIVEAACRVIARLGMHEFRVEDVATEVGVSPALVYYYFNTRDQLIRKAFEFADARSSVVPALDGLSGADQVRRTLLNEVSGTTAVRENWVIWGETAAAAVFDKDLRGSLTDWANTWVKQIADLIRDGQRDGSIASELDAEDTAEFLTSVVDSMGWRWLIGSITLERAHEVIDRSVDVGLRLPATA